MQKVKKQENKYKNIFVKEVRKLFCVDIIETGSTKIGYPDLTLHTPEAFFGVCFPVYVEFKDCHPLTLERMKTNKFPFGPAQYITLLERKRLGAVALAAFAVEDSMYVTSVSNFDRESLHLLSLERCHKFSTAASFCSYMVSIIENPIIRKIMQQYTAQLATTKN